jgi:hypothetical protein
MPSSRARRRRRAALQAIHKAAVERQALWRAGGERYLVAELTRDLNGREEDERPNGLYAELRDERAGEPSNPYRGTTTSVAGWRVPPVSQNTTQRSEAPAGTSASLDTRAREEGSNVACQ